MHGEVTLSGKVYRLSSEQAAAAGGTAGIRFNGADVLTVNSTASTRSFSGSATSPMPASAGRRLRSLRRCLQAPPRCVAAAAEPPVVDEAGQPPLHFLSVADAAAQFAAGSLTPPQLLDALFDRIDATEGRINSFVLQTRALARRQATASAARWAAGEQLSPMDGVPIVLKDIFDTAGMVTASGCHGLRDRVPDADAHTVGLLRAAGAVFVGKTYTVEFASAGATAGCR